MSDQTIFYYLTLINIITNNIKIFNQIAQYNFVLLLLLADKEELNYVSLCQCDSFDNSILKCNQRRNKLQQALELVVMIHVFFV